MALNIKKAIDAYFKDNWLATSIQFEEGEFKQPASNEWINLVYAPYDRDVYAYDGSSGRKRTYVVTMVRCFSTSATKAYDLAGQVQTMFECETIGAIKVDVGKGDGNGAVDLENGLWQVTVNFDTISYE